MVMVIRLLLLSCSLVLPLVVVPGVDGTSSSLRRSNALRDGRLERD